MKQWMTILGQVMKFEKIHYSGQSGSVKSDINDLNITGTAEYLIKVETSGISQYKILHTEVLGTLSQVNSIQTLVILESLVE